MRQVNVAGASPFSPSSRVIQTLQAPPDVAPTSVTVRTASETSLRLRWVVSGQARGPRGLVCCPRSTREPRAPSVLSPPLCPSGLISSLSHEVWLYGWCWVPARADLSH